jgi:hypothetical protein
MEAMRLGFLILIATLAAPVGVDPAQLRGSGLRGCRWRLGHDAGSRCDVSRECARWRAGAMHL